MTTVSMPAAIEAEQAVLGGLMLAPEALARVDWLTEADFSRDDHRIVFRAITELARRGEPCDAVTLGEWFESNGLAELVGGVSYVIKLANATPSAANITAYAEIVSEKAKLRAAMDAGAAVSAAAAKPGAESGLVVADAMHRLSQLQETHYRGGLQPTKPILRRVMQEMQKRHAEKAQLLGLPTPWRDVNKMLRGLRPGVLYVVGGRPSMGKTVFGLQIAAFTAARGNNTAVFSAEMTADECMQRMLAANGDIPHDWIDLPNDDDYPDADLYWNRLTNATAALSQAPLLIDETPAIRHDQITARARKAHMQRPLELIVTDHLHDMDHGTDSKGMRHAIGRAVQAHKTLAKTLNIPVVLLAQLNRGPAEAKGRRPTLIDLRECGEIEQKADVVLFLHREDYYDRDTHLQGIVEVIPAKGRNLKIGETTHLQKRFDVMRMDDLDGELPEPPMQSRRPRGFGRQQHAA